MVIRIVDCQSSKGIVGAAVLDIYGQTTNTDSFGNIQITPGTENMYLNTLIKVSASGYVTDEFTLSSMGLNQFCLTAEPPNDVTGGY